MRLTIFMSSPRKGGNSDKIAEAFIAGAKAGGNHTTTVVIRECAINGCLGCEYCYDHNGECIQQDDMQDIYRILENTDVIIFATPIYYQGFPSQLKAVVDRLYVSENRDFPISGSVLLATYATEGHSMAEQTLSYYRCLANYHEWKNLGEITIGGLDEKDDILGSPALKSAYELGRCIG